MFARALAIALGCGLVESKSAKSGARPRVSCPDEASNLAKTSKTPRFSRGYGGGIVARFPASLCGRYCIGETHSRAHCFAIRKRCNLRGVSTGQVLWVKKQYQFLCRQSCRLMAPNWFSVHSFSHAKKDRHHLLNSCSSARISQQSNSGRLCLPYTQTLA